MNYIPTRESMKYFGIFCAILFVFICATLFPGDIQWFLYCGIVASTVLLAISQIKNNNYWYAMLFGINGIYAVFMLIGLAIV